METEEGENQPSNSQPIFKVRTPKERLLERKKYHESILRDTNRALELLGQDPNIQEILEILWD